MARALKNATSKVPIVTYTVDPVVGGLIGNLARPGGNITGFSADAGPHLIHKTIEVLVQAAPHVGRVVHLLPKSSWISTLGPRTKAVVMLGAADGELSEEDDYHRFFATLSDRRAESGSCIRHIHSKI